MSVSPEEVCVGDRCLGKGNLKGCSELGERNIVVRKRKSSEHRYQ